MSSLFLRFLLSSVGNEFMDVQLDWGNLGVVWDPRLKSHPPIKTTRAGFKFSREVLRVTLRRPAGLTKELTRH